MTALSPTLPKVCQRRRLLRYTELKYTMVYLAQVHHRASMKGKTIHNLLEEKAKIVYSEWMRDGQSSLIFLPMRSVRSRALALFFARRQQSDVRAFADTNFGLDDTPACQSQTSIPVGWCDACRSHSSYLFILEIPSVKFLSLNPKDVPIPWCYKKN